MKSQLFLALLMTALTAQASAAHAQNVVPRPDESSIPKWRLVWHDEFNGPNSGDDPACFARIPQCQYKENSKPGNCPESTWRDLEALNKCNWAVLHRYNDLGNKPGKGINAFDAHQVIVRDGELVLKAQSLGSDHDDCGRIVEVTRDDPRNPVLKNRTTDCAFISGGVESRSWGTVPENLKGKGKDKDYIPLKGKHTEGYLPGFGQKYGRFEVRARLPHGPGSWPAHRLLPQERDDPSDGIIHLMESSASSAFQVTGSLEGGMTGTSLRATRSFNFNATPRYYPEHRAKSFYKEYHLYAVEWEPMEIRFYVDHHLIGTVKDGDKGSINLLQRMPLRIPSRPMHLALTSSIAAFFDEPGKFRPRPDRFEPQTHHIDYIRVFKLCQDNEIGCIESP